MKTFAPLLAPELRLGWQSLAAMRVLKGQTLFIDRLLEALGQTES